jgi:polyphenol oxidase
LVAVFYKDSRNIYRVGKLDALEWLMHGFGTRDPNVPAMFANLATARQIHSAECLFAEGRSGALGKADALLENTPGAVVAVKTADCLPILLVDERHKVVAAVHAGWRGSAAGIAQRAVKSMGERFGTRPGDLHAAIGPGIGKCCYEVGPDVAARFGAETRTHVDLPAANRRQLLETGIRRERVYTAELCTKCNPTEFHSFRRDGEAAGRQYSFAGIRPAVE